MRSLDPRSWNLFMGVALFAGCGVPSPSNDDSSSGTDATGNSASETASGGTDATGTDTTDTDSETTVGICDNCQSDSDCQSNNCGSVCYLGSCYNYPPCYDYLCSTFEVCEMGDCTSLGFPIPSCGLEFDIPTVHELGAPPLALSFVDVDDDGDDELVVATEAELLVYEFDSAVPTVSQRMPTAVDETHMVAGHFDAEPGEDVTLLVEGEYHRYFSDGIASLVSPSVEPCPLLGAMQLLAAEFDALPPTDLLIWGDDGAMLDLTNATVLLSTERIDGAAVYEYGSPDAGVFLIRHYAPVLFDFMGNELSFAAHWANKIGALRGIGQSKYFALSKHDPQFYWPWYEVRVLDATTLDETSSSLFQHVGPDYDHGYDYAGGTVVGDFDGDQYDEILTSFGWANPLQVMFGAFAQPCVATQDLGPDPVSYDIAVGDHDGDGDDEAALMQGDRVVIIDLEP